MKRVLSEIKVQYHVYRVNNLRVVDEEKHRVLNDIARKVGNVYRCVAVRYTLTNDFNGVVVYGLSKPVDKFTIDGYELELVDQGEGLSLPHFRVKNFFYEILRAKLRFHGYWSAAYNKYYRLAEDDTIDRRFRIFRGIFFRFEILSDGSVLLVLDPITRIVSYDTVYELASQWGYAKARTLLKGRYIVTLVVKRKELSRSLLKVYDFRPDLKAGVDKVIDIGGTRYTIKEYYSDYLGLPKVADLIPDDAPIIEAAPPSSNRKLYVAASMAYINYRTNEVPLQYTKEIEDKVFIDPDQRLMLTKSFLNSINPLNYPQNDRIGYFEFEDEPIVLHKERANVFEPPKLRFGKDAKAMDLSHYTKFFKESLRELGVAKRIAIPANSKIAVVYPENYITDNEAKLFYRDVAIASKKIFGVTLPSNPFLWGYRDHPQPVIRNYSKFRDRVLAAIVILRSDRDELYEFYKKQFRDKASQMATVKLVRLKEQLPKEKLHKYRNAIINLASGLLGKLGLRPWLLEDKLVANAYVGIDLLPGRAAVMTLMDSRGNYVSEAWVAQRGSKICSDDMYSSLYQLIIENLGELEVGDEFSIVFMKDGDVYEEELEGVRRFIKSIVDRYSIVKYAVLSVKKNIPYRIYAYKDSRASYPSVGSYAVLGERYGILASSGYPLIRNRLAKPLLIELVESLPRGWYNIPDALSESYRLSFMHWATLTQKTKYPAPIKYADDLSTLISRGIRTTGPPL